MFNRIKTAAILLCTGYLPNNACAVEHEGYTAVGSYAAELAHKFSLIEEAHAMRLGHEANELLDSLLSDNMTDEEFFSEMYSMLKKEQEGLPMEIMGNAGKGQSFAVPDTPGTIIIDDLSNENFFKYGDKSKKRFVVRVGHSYLNFGRGMSSPTLVDQIADARLYRSKAGAFGLAHKWINSIFSDKKNTETISPAVHPVYLDLMPSIDEAPKKSAPKSTTE